MHKQVKLGNLFLFSLSVWILEVVPLSLIEPFDIQFPLLFGSVHALLTMVFFTVWSLLWTKSKAASVSAKEGLLSIFFILLMVGIIFCWLMRTMLWASTIVVIFIGAAIFVFLAWHKRGRKVFAPSMTLSIFYFLFVVVFLCISVPVIYKDPVAIEGIAFWLVILCPVNALLALTRIGFAFILMFFTPAIYYFFLGRAFEEFVL